MKVPNSRRNLDAAIRRITGSDREYLRTRTVLLEIGHNEIDDAESPDYGVPGDVIDLFAELGIPEPAPIPLMRLDHQVAQKLHALTSPGSDRPHDLIDLQLIVARGDLDFRLVRQTCERLFVYRNQQKWPPVISKGPAWDDVYADQKEELGVLPSVDEAIDWGNELIRRIASAGN